MNLTDIISRVRNLSGDINANQFTNDVLIDWINAGVRECAVENNLLQISATQNTVNGTNQYDLPTDILKLYTVTLQGQKIIINSLADNDTQGFDPSETGLPVRGYVWAKKLTLWPTPDQAYALQINYIREPADLTAGDMAVPPDLPSSYHARLVDYAMAQIALQDDDINMYQLKLEEFSTGIKKLSDQSDSEEDVYPSVLVSPRDSGEGTLYIQEIF